jgi:hypothetical protein
MNRTRKMILVALVALNLGLVASLVHLNTPEADAKNPTYKSSYPQTDYLAVTGRLGSTDGLYIIDLRTRKLGMWKWNQGRRKLSPIGSRDLDTDMK